MNAYVCFCLVFTSDAHALKQNHQNYTLFNILIKQSLSNKAVNCTYNKSIICTILQNSEINRRIKRPKRGGPTATYVYAHNGRENVSTELQAVVSG